LRRVPSFSGEAIPPGYIHREAIPPGYIHREAYTTVYTYQGGIYHRVHLPGRLYPAIYTREAIPRYIHQGGITRLLRVSGRHNPPP